MNSRCVPMWFISHGFNERPGVKVETTVISVFMNTNTNHMIMIYIHSLVPHWVVAGSSGSSCFAGGKKTSKSLNRNENIKTTKTGASGMFSRLQHSLKLKIPASVARTYCAFSAWEAQVGIKPIILVIPVSYAPHWRSTLGGKKTAFFENDSVLNVTLFHFWITVFPTIVALNACL